MELEIVVASVPDREKLVAEIWADGEMFAEISQETQGRIEIAFFPKQNGYWQIEYEPLLNILSDARRKLNR